MLLVLRQERLTLLVVLLALAALGTWIWSASGLTRAVSATVAVDVALIFAYTWSLGEAIHVSVQATPTGYIATAGGNTLRLPLVPVNQPLRWSPIAAGLRDGLYSSPVLDYKASPIGAAQMAAPTTPLTWIAQSLRFAVPGPAWSNLQIVGSAGRNIRFGQSNLSDSLGSWTKNPRGELQGSLGSSGYFPPIPGHRYELSGNLVRADGVQGFLVDVNSIGRGFLFTVSLDRRYLRWFTWHGSRGRLLAEQPILSLAPVPMVQRVLRFALPSVILGLLLVTAVLAVYCVLLPVSPMLERVSEKLACRLRRRPRIGFRAADSLALGFAAVSVAAASWVAVRLYRGVPNVQDGITDLFQARTLALGRLWVPAPAIPAFFTEPYVFVHNGHWIGKYPPGWPLVLSLGVLVKTPWVVDPIMGAIGLLVLYLIGREVYGRKVASVATLLASTSPFLLFINGSFFPHTTSWVFLGGFAYLVIKCVRSAPSDKVGPLSTWRADAVLLVPAGVLLAFAFATRQLDALAFSLPFVLILLRRPLTLIWLVLGGAVPGLLWLSYNLAVIGDVLGNGYALVSSWDRLGFGNVGGAPGTYDSRFTVARSIWNVATEIQHLQSSLFGWPYFFALALAALPFIVGRASRWDCLFLASILCVVAAYMFYWADGVAWNNFPRYWYVAVPLLALLSARGVQELYRLPLSPALRLPVRPAAALIAPAILLAFLIGFDVEIFLPPTAALVGQWNSRNLNALQTVERAHIHNAIVFEAQGDSNWWPFGGVFPQNSPLLNGDVVWARDRGSLDAELMRLYPGRAYYRLNDLQLTRLYP